MSDLKPRQLQLMKKPRRTVKEIVADGFKERTWKRDQKRLQRIEYAKVYKARKAREAALIAKLNSAIKSSKEAERAKLPKSKSAGGTS